MSELSAEEMENEDGLKEIDLETPNQEESVVSRLQNVSGFNELLPNQKGNEMTEEQLQDVEDGKKEWAREYDNCIDNPPEEGDVLTTLEEDDKVLLTVELNENAPPFIYGRVYVPEIVGQPLGWYLQSGDGQNFHGWKCILLPRARTELIRKFGLQKETMEVVSLKVIRESQSGKSLLCEVHEYGDEKEKEKEKVEHHVQEDTKEEVTDTKEKVTETETETETDIQKPDVAVADLQ